MATAESASRRFRGTSWVICLVRRIMAANSRAPIPAIPPRTSAPIRWVASKPPCSFAAKSGSVPLTIAKPR